MLQRKLTLSVALIALAAAGCHDDDADSATPRRTPSSLPVKFQHTPRADVLGVEFVSAREVSTGLLAVELRVRAIASACETYDHVADLGGQTSLDDVLNPTDHYFEVRTNFEPDCITGSFGDVVEFATTIELGAPFGDVGRVHHLSFNAGMLGGFNRWSMFQLDLGDLDDVSFEFVKTYTYVQGQVVNEGDERD